MAAIGWIDRRVNVEVIRVPEPSTGALTLLIVAWNKTRQSTFLQSFEWNWEDSSTAELFHAACVQLNCVSNHFAIDGECILEAWWEVDMKCRYLHITDMSAVCIWIAAFLKSIEQWSILLKTVVLNWCICAWTKKMYM